MSQKLPIVLTMMESEVITRENERETTEESGVCFEIVQRRVEKHTKHDTTNNIRWMMALHLFLKSTCFLSALRSEILVRVSMQDCGENHSGWNCVAEQRSATKCVSQSICRNCAAGADVAPRNSLACWDLQSTCSEELSWTW